jgi:hypothetical protein
VQWKVKWKIVIAVEEITPELTLTEPLAERDRVATAADVEVY